VENYGTPDRTKTPLGGQLGTPTIELAVVTAEYPDYMLNVFF